MKKDWMFGALGLLALCACVFFVVTQNYAVMCGATIVAACTTFYLLEGSNNKSKNKNR